MQFSCILSLAQLWIKQEAFEKVTEEVRTNLVVNGSIIFNHAL